MTKIPSQYKFQKTFWIMACACTTLVGSYVYLVGQTVHNVLERQNAEKEISVITAEVSALEFAYLNSKAGINADMARNLGFVEVSKTLVAKKVVNTALSFRNEI